MKVFISYSQEARALARKVGEALDRAGLDAWYDEKIFPGDNWGEEIAQALKESEAMVVLLTPNALHSTNVRREIDFALTNKNFNKRLIPVLVGFDDSDNFVKEQVPWIFHHLNIIKLPAYGTQEEGINRITQAVRDAA